MLTSTPDSVAITQILTQSLVGVRRTAGSGYETAAGSPAGLLASWIIGAAYTGYLYSNPEALQKVKLESVVLAEYWMEADRPINRGWVFFPKGSYREVKITVMQRSPPRRWSSAADAPIEEIKLPWITPPPPAGSDLWVEYGIPPWSLPE